jgi:hypothetical protein
METAIQSRQKPGRATKVGAGWPTPTGTSGTSGLASLASACAPPTQPRRPPRRRPRPGHPETAPVSFRRSDPINGSGSAAVSPTREGCTPRSQTQQPCGVALARKHAIGRRFTPAAIDAPPGTALRPLGATARRRDSLDRFLPGAGRRRQPGPTSHRDARAGLGGGLFRVRASGGRPGCGRAVGAWRARWRRGSGRSSRSGRGLGRSRCCCGRRPRGQGLRTRVG